MNLFLTGLACIGGYILVAGALIVFINRRWAKLREEMGISDDQG